MPDSFEVVVVGAGLLGASVARECALRGLEVALVEGREVASGASGVGAILLGDELPTGGDARTLASLASLAPHLVKIVPVRDVGLGSVVDVTRLTQLYVLDAVERGVTFLCGVPVARITDGQSQPARRVVLEDGEEIEARTVVVATGASTPDAPGIASPESRRLRVVDVDVPPPNEGRLVGDVLYFPTPTGARLILSSADEEALLPALEAHAMIDAPIVGSETHDVAVAGHARQDAAPGLVRVSESSPGAHRDVATYLADAFAHKAGRDLASLSHDAVLPGGDSLIATEPLSEHWEVPELAVRAMATRHGSRVADILGRAAKAPRERALLCECQAILECEVRHACRVEGARTLTDLARRTGLGNGACRGIDCAPRAAQIVREETGADADALNEAVFAFLNEGFRRRAPFLRAADLAREEQLLARLSCCGLATHDEEER
jgi:glycerol-3-phosphate dehydrogenase